jgi:hypothetical protein
MCTLSWLKTQDGYEIFFNRDEQRSRSIASIPELYNTPSGNQFIMPTDLDSGGSWIGLTEAGISVCLLNFYQGVTPNSILISRGLLVKNLLGLNNLDEMLNELSRMALDCYAPFTLAIFDPEQDQPICFCWDGVTFTDIKIKSPYTSSGVEFPQVSHARQQTFRQHFKDRPKCIDQLKAFHRSHLPEKSKWSVCMHREDASTVSFSHLSINPFNSVFHYVAGSPCQQDAQQTSHVFNRNNLMSKSA